MSMIGYLENTLEGVVKKGVEVEGGVGVSAEYRVGEKWKNGMGEECVVSMEKYLTGRILLGGGGSGSWDLDPSGRVLR